MPRCTLLPLPDHQVAFLVDGAERLRWHFGPQYPRPFFYPLVGPARHHKCHYKCTVFYDKTQRSGWPVPFEFTDATEEVVYIDHDHLIRCAGGPGNGVGVGPAGGGSCGGF